MNGPRRKPSDLPTAIQSIRERLGLTQVAFGERVFVRQANVSKWESGATEPDLRSLIELLRLAQDEEETAPIVNALASRGVSINDLAGIAESTGAAEAVPC